MPPGPVVQHFNLIEEIGPGQIPDFVYSFPDAFFLPRTEERFGHRIIPEQLPHQFILIARLLARRGRERSQSSLPYWLPGYPSSSNEITI